MTSIPPAPKLKGPIHCKTEGCDGLCYYRTDGSEVNTSRLLECYGECGRTYHENDFRGG